MTTAQQTGDVLTYVMRGIALAFGLLANRPFLLFLISSGAKTCSKLSWSRPNEMPLFIVLTTATVGFVIAWRYEMIGGTIAVVCAIAVSALVYFGSGRAVFSTALMISLPFFIAGLLFLICCWKTRVATMLA